MSILDFLDEMQEQFPAQTYPFWEDVATVERALKICPQWVTWPRVFGKVWPVRVRLNAPKWAARLLSASGGRTWPRLGPLVGQAFDLLGWGWVIQEWPIGKDMEA